MYIQSSSEWMNPVEWILRNGKIDLAETLHAQISAQGSIFLLKNFPCSITFFDRLSQKKPGRAKLKVEPCPDICACKLSAKSIVPFLRIRRQNAVHFQLDSSILNWIECTRFWFMFTNKFNDSL